MENTRNNHGNNSFIKDHAGIQTARMFSAGEVTAIYASLQELFQEKIEEVREEAAENVNDAYNE